jgi:hypothetical protein
MQFLKNDSMLDLITFFVYNFLYIFESEKILNFGIINNDFSRLKALDLFFNLSLLLDEILKTAYLNHNKNYLILII